MFRRGVSACAWVLGSILAAGCAEPPNIEMDQAQGAIDAAQAAGAEQYATTEYGAATTALKSANDAVAAGDYRLALNYALESREHAQNAARDTANTKARMRSDIERGLVEIDALIAKGEAQIASAQRARVAARQLRQPAAELADAKADLQDPREAVGRGDYLGAAEALDGVKKRVEKVLMEISSATTPQPSRRRG
jgi:multidrug efflux pump subunit AcrA (membrane-fusion protein)